MRRMLSITSILVCGMLPAQVAPSTPGARLTLIPAEPVSEMRLPDRAPAAAPKTAVTAGSTPEPATRSSKLDLLPAGDPIYLGDEKPASPLDQWRTYSPARVDSVSRDGQGVALQGFDVISYLDQHAEPGQKTYAFDYKGLTWLFANGEHLRLFSRQPEQYIPEYGGFCAYSIGRGYPATADPKIFTLEGGKLYFFFDRAARSVWQQDQRNMVAAADRNWPKLHR